MRLRPLAACIALIAWSTGPVAFAKTDMTISANGTTTAPCTSGICSANGPTSVLITSDLQTALSAGSVNVDATAGAGDGGGSIDWTDGVVDAGGNSLTLTAVSSITFDGGLTSLDNLLFAGTSLHGGGFASGTGSITGLGNTAFHLTGTKAGSAGGIMFSGFASADANTVTGATTFDASAGTSGGMVFGNATSVVGAGTGATLAGAGLTYTLDDGVANAGTVNHVAFIGFGNIDDATGTVRFGGASGVTGNVTASALDYLDGTSPAHVNLSGTGSTGIGGVVSGVSEVGAVGALEVSGTTSDGLLGLYTTGAGSALTLDALSVGSLTAGAAGAMLVNGTVASDAGVSLTAQGAIAEGPSGGILAETLTGAAAGAATLTGENQVASLGDFTAAGFDFRDGQALTVGGTVDGGTAGTAITTTAGDLTVGGTVGNTAGMTTLVSAGVIQEGASGVVRADTLTGRSDGATSLLGANDIANVGDFTADGFALNSTGPLRIAGTLASSSVTLTDATDPIILTGTIDAGSGAGTVTINGALSMLGDLDIGVDGAAGGEFGLVNVTGDVLFGAPAAFHFTFGNGFAGAAGDTFDFFTAGSINGFAYVGDSFDCAGLAPGLTCGLGLNAGGNGLVLALRGTAVDTPEPSPLGLMGLGLLLLGGGAGWRKWRARGGAWRR